MIYNEHQDGIITDPLSQISRRSLQRRRSLDPSRIILEGSDYDRGDREGLISAYDEEANVGFGLQTFAKETNEEIPDEHTNGSANGYPSMSDQQKFSNHLKINQNDQLPPR